MAVWVLLVLGVAVQAGPIKLGSHANDLAKAFGAVEQIYRESQPQHIPTRSPSPSPSTILDHVSASPTSIPSPSPSASKGAEEAISGVTSRDVTGGPKIETGDLDHEENRRYPVWWPEGRENFRLQELPYSWVIKPNRFGFMKPAILDFPQRDFDTTSLRTLATTLHSAFEDGHNAEFAFAGPHPTEEFMEGPVRHSSRPIGTVHRYLGYIPKSQPWTGHPYFNAIDRVAQPCKYSRSFNCVPLSDLPPIPSSSPSVTPTRTPSPTPTSSPSSSPEPPVVAEAVLPPPPDFEVNPPLEQDAPFIPVPVQTIIVDPVPTIIADPVPVVVDLEAPVPAPVPPPPPPHFQLEDAEVPVAVGTAPILAEPVQVERTLVMREVASDAATSSPVSNAKGALEDPAVSKQGDPTVVAEVAEKLVANGGAEPVQEVLLYD